MESWGVLLILSCVGHFSLLVCVLFVLLLSRPPLPAVPVPVEAGQSPLPASPAACLSLRGLSPCRRCLLPGSSVASLSPHRALPLPPRDHADSDACVRVALSKWRPCPGPRVTAQRTAPWKAGTLTSVSHLRKCPGGRSHPARQQWLGFAPGLGSGGRLELACAVCPPTVGVGLPLPALRRPGLRGCPPPPPLPAACSVLMVSH